MSMSIIEQITLPRSQRIVVYVGLVAWVVFALIEWFLITGV